MCSGWVDGLRVSVMFVGCDALSGLRVQEKDWVWGLAIRVALNG